MAADCLPGEALNSARTQGVIIRFNLGIPQGGRSSWTAPMPKKVKSRTTRHSSAIYVLSYALVEPQYGGLKFVDTWDLLQFAWKMSRVMLPYKR